jgi:CRP/FNR family transcriptional regulator, cyclic AMP receptor protein
MRKAMYLMGILDDSDINWMAEKGSVKALERGAVLIQEGEPVGSLFVLLDGNLSVVTGHRQVASLFSGEIVGEISFVDSRPPSASVTAGEKSHVLAIPRSALQDKLDRDFKFAANFYRALAVFLADRLRTTTSRLGYGDAHQDEHPHENQDGDELTDDLMDSASLAVVRFDGLLKKLRVT